MDALLSFPNRTYRYIDAEYGSLGLIMAGLLIVVAAIGLLTWIDRRK
jgi:hypothetical protein